MIFYLFLLGDLKDKSNSQFTTWYAMSISTVRGKAPNNLNLFDNQSSSYYITASYHIKIGLPHSIGVFVAGLKIS